MAIAFVAGAGAHANSNTQSSALDCTGASILIAGVWGVGDLSTGVTYNSVVMTQLGASFQYNSGEFMRLYYLVNPATGSHTITASFSGSANSSLSAACFSGSATTGFPDAQNTNSGVTGAGSVTITTIADNAMGVAFSRFESGVPTTSAGMTLGFDSTFSAIYYTTALKTPPGSLTMNATSSAPTIEWGMMGVSIAPPTATITHFFNLLGVGT